MTKNYFSCGIAPALLLMATTFNFTSCAEDSATSGAMASASLAGDLADRSSLFSINLPSPENTEKPISSVDLLKGIDPSMNLSIGQIMEKCIDSEEPPTVSEPPPPAEFCPTEPAAEVASLRTSDEFHWLQINEDMWLYQPSGLYHLNMVEMAKIANTKEHKVLSVRYKDSAGEILANLCTFGEVGNCPIGETEIKLGEDYLRESPDNCKQCKCTDKGILCTQTACPVRCEQGGNQYEPGQTWKNGSCQQCSCKEDGSVSCENITTGSCGVCVETKGWNKGNYKFGDTWRRDKCYTCKCDESGQISCEKSQSLICKNH